MASKYASTPQTTNAAKVYRAIFDPCTDIFRDILRIHIPEIQFLTTLRTSKDELRKIVKGEQRELLYPPNGQFCGTYDNFDLGLLYILLRNVSGIPPHKNGWGKTPDSTDRSESANIDRLREIRNTYCGHQPRSSLSDPEFKKVWAELKQIVEELERDVLGGHNTYLNAIKLLEKDTMDPEQEEMYLKSIAVLQDGLLGKQIQLEEQLTVQLQRQERQEEKLNKLATVQLHQGMDIKELKEFRHQGNLRKLNGEQRIKLTSGRNMSSGGRQSSLSSRNTRRRGWTHKRGRGTRGARQDYPIPRQVVRTRHVQERISGLDNQLQTYEMTTTDLRDSVWYFWGRQHEQWFCPSWCLCGNCREMQSMEENVCCRQTPGDCMGFDLVVLGAPTLLGTPRRRVLFFMNVRYTKMRLF